MDAMVNGTSAIVTQIKPSNPEMKDKHNVTAAHTGGAMIIRIAFLPMSWVMLAIKMPKNIGRITIVDILTKDIQSSSLRNRVEASNPK